MSFTRFFSLVLLIAFPVKGFCWGAMGHQIVGAIADERMTPAAKGFVAGIMGIEPAAIAAVWADAVRDDARYGHDEHENDRAKKDADDFNFSDYHFVEVPSTFTYDTRPNHALKDSFGAITGALKILRDTSGQTKQTEKVIALRYLIHLVGDIHQPLHVGNDHDIGANFCLAYWKNGKEPRNLHTLWDTDMVNEVGLALKDPAASSKFPPNYYPEYMAALKKFRNAQLYADKPKDVSIAAIKSWINESADIRENKAARDVGVYPEKAGQMSQYLGTEYMHRPYCMWFEDSYKGTWGATSPHNKSDIPTNVIPHLDSTYVALNEKVVERQLITAGIRLAALLDDVAQDVARHQPSESVPLSEQELILKTVQGIFHNPVQ